MSDQQTPRIVPPLEEPEFLTGEPTGHSDEFLRAIGMSLEGIADLRKREATWIREHPERASLATELGHADAYSA